MAEDWAGVLAEPVFVLCNGRSGSTLLRFILDAHPELACPPETNVAALCAQLATVWSLIEGAPLSANRGDEPPQIPQAAIAGVRETMDRMVGSYLARRGKRRYCDKSLGTARYARLLQRVYPAARFVCVYRHPMDVIASGLEACPWGLTGYGFDPYIAATPGNAVMALARFWADSVHAALAVEEEMAGQCFRVRYEDLVADPEATAAELFGFVGVAPVPGISRSCFSAERERFGPADYKIWYTSKISSDSVGRGWSVPTAMIGPELLGVINEMAARLGYLTVDDEWGTSEPPADLRVAAAGTDAQPGPALAAGAEPAAAGTVPATPDSARSARLYRQLSAALAACSGQAVRQRWEPHDGEAFVAVAVMDDPACPAEYWRVDLGEATVTRVGKQAQQSSAWDVIGTQQAWEQVIDHKVNLSAALRRCQLRYCDNGEATPLAADKRVGILGELLGVAGWR